MGAQVENIISILVAGTILIRLKRIFSSFEARKVEHFILTFSIAQLNKILFKKQAL